MDQNAGMARARRLHTELRSTARVRPSPRAYVTRADRAQNAKTCSAYTKKSFQRATVMMLWVMEAFGCGCVWARNVARTELPGLSVCVCADKIWFHELDNIYE